MNKLALTALLLFNLVGLYAQREMNVKEAYEEANKLLQTLTFEEKASMVRGYNSFFLKGIERKGIPPIYLSDATQGVNIRTNLPNPNMVKQLEKSTAFPAPILLASTFSPELSYQYAKAVGEECRAGGIEILLGPGLNIYRQSQCSRNFEYFGEDPYLVARMVEEYVKGMQSTGTAACLKHFLGNNTEFYRKRSNSIISERAINEIYLPGFKAGIDAGAMCVMTSYNQLNGDWVGQNPYAIKELLRKQLGFSWLVMSDWNSVWDLEKVVKSGQNVEMPGSYDFGTSIVELFNQGKITEKDLDNMLLPTLATCIAMNFYKRPKYEPSLLSTFPMHEKIAKRVAEEGIVLLENRDNILPLDPAVNRKILLTGKFVSEIPRGYGAAEVIGYNNVRLVDALQKEFGRTVYYIEHPTVAELQEADIVILSMGTRDREAVERPFTLPNEEEGFMRYITSNHKNVIAVINSGSAINMSAWNDKVAALIYGWYGGQSGFEALTDIITGKVNPSGKLPISIEKDFKDSPAWGYLPKGASLYNECKNEFMIKVYDIHYNEDILVGYRWYDTQNIEPLYPFGHGLSYTTFSLTKPELTVKKITGSQPIKCTVVLTNIGKRKGSEVVQLYVREDNPTLLRPVKELKQFDKIALSPGEKRIVEFELTKQDFAFWDEQSHGWKVNPGRYTIMLGTSSKAIEHSLSFVIEK
ncbi:MULTISPECIES: beta-glucosidase family protein [Bacteroides]|uniref:Glycosyl hydrolase n=1 Tax=Bacteroides ovatus TaxID=28116 RepID=A0A413ESU6_BACOV|nr:MULTISPECIES: glycoside hydrolase family 3 N-terminal domain-containing protein [Bacteroides]RGE76658.1 glycosyl hydrolase [Bacteroides sp. AF32-8BH]RGX10647.1 glycosyl hydrolase [Bacteroides ovatus]RGX25623.1 glycosyl hydrolase [Bacteroides ovatus]